MVREIVHDPLFLARKSVPATEADRQVVTDLLDTLLANRARFIGMAANMIGVHKCIIAVFNGPLVMGMINPEITKRKGPYETEEGCLSLAGVRKTKRWETITVKYLDRDFRQQVNTFQGFTAQIIQHEIDHCGGILI